MEKGAKAKSLLNNNVLWGILGALVLVIIVLIGGIIAIKLNGDPNNPNDEGILGEAENVQIAQKSCDIIAEGMNSDNEDTYLQAVKDFESVNTKEGVSGNQDFSSCYAGVRTYYVKTEDDAKVEYYDEVMREFVTDEEIESQKQLLEEYMNESEENRAKVEALQQQYREETGEEVDEETGGNS